MNLRKAAKAAEAATYHYDSDQSCYDENVQKADSDMDLPAHKLNASYFPPRKESRRTLRLTTSSPMLHQQYQSDEEQPSPSPNSYTDSYEEDENDRAAADMASDGGSCEADTELDDYTDDEAAAASPSSDSATPRPEPTVLTAAALAVAIPILAVGRPRVVSISSLAPMHKRAAPAAQPGSRLSASYTTLRRFRAPAPTTIRPSTPPRQLTPPHRQDVSPRTSRTTSPSASSTLSDSSPPSHTHSGSSPASTAPSSACGDSSFDAEERAAMEEDEGSAPASVLAGTEWDPTVLEAPTPVSYAAYDPFALAPPTLGLGKEGKGTSGAAGAEGEGNAGGRVRRWRGLGLRARVRPSRKTSTRWSDHVEV